MLFNQDLYKCGKTDTGMPIPESRLRLSRWTKSHRAAAAAWPTNPSQPSPAPYMQDLQSNDKT